MWHQIFRYFKRSNRRFFDSFRLIEHFLNEFQVGTEGSAEQPNQLRLYDVIDLLVYSL